MLARWYLLLGQFSVTFEYRPRMGCLANVASAEQETEMVDQPFAASEMGESMDADLLPELSGETWVASALIEEFTADLLPAGSNVDLIAASRQDATLATVREWIQSESTMA